MTKTGWLDSRLARKRNLTTNELYWAAGIFEGEGSIGMYNKIRSKKNHGECARVGQNGRWLPDKLQELFGGSVIKQPDKSCNGNDFYTWTVSGARARGFLQTIFVLLSPRRQNRIIDMIEQCK